MQPIPVDDYAVPHNTPHHHHDIYSLSRERPWTRRMSVTVGGDFDQTRVVNIVLGLDWTKLIGKMKCGNITFLAFRLSSATVYHAVRGECNCPIMYAGPKRPRMCNNYTGEFIRAMQGLPEHLIPVGGIWPTPLSMETILDRELPLYFQIKNLSHRWGVHDREVYHRIFRDYPDMPVYNTTYRTLSGYEILEIYGKI